MKDLLVYVADADAEAVFAAVLKRHQSLNIREITFEIKRCPNHDCGVVKYGAGLARLEKQKYAKALLVLDFHGSGREHKGAADDCAKWVQGELDRVTWSNHSAVAVLVPELEEWLWRNPRAIADYLGWAVERLDQAVANYAKQRPREAVLAENPKEVWEHVMKREARRTISPADFRKIAEKAGLKAWRDSPSFGAVIEILQNWFPSA